MGPNDKVRVVVEHDQWRRALKVFIGLERADGGESFVDSLVFRDSTHQFIDKPTLEGRVAEQFLQAALDAAWEAGLRPAGFADVPLQVAAKDAHLEDMRKLVFLLLGDKQPNPTVDFVERGIAK